MMNRRWMSLPLVLAAGLVTAAPAFGAVRLGLGADYWFNGEGVFNINLAIDTELVRHFSIGGRFGALITTSPTVGVPIDLELRGHFEHLYVEGLIGPWLVFEGFPVRFHGAVGFGFQTRGISIGLEVGYLSDAPIGGLRVAFRF